MSRFRRKTKSGEKVGRFIDRLKFSQDYRAKLPDCLSRFTGYRAPDAGPVHAPLPFPPFSWLTKIPLKYETWLFAWVGAFGSMILIEAIMSTSTAFRDDYKTPIIVTSFGASAVLVFGLVDAPVSQPRNLVFGHFVSALVGTCITRLFVLNSEYQGYLQNTHFHPSTFINGAVSMATSLLLMLVTGTVHPPAGATGLNAAVLPDVVSLSWRYLPTVLASSLIMLGWAVIFNNLGRRRYPVYWWAPGTTFTVPTEEKYSKSLRQIEEAEMEGRED